MAKGKRMRMGKGLAIVALAAGLLSACSDRLKGTFADDMGMSSLTFRGDGTVVQASGLAGVELEMRYEVEGDKVRLTHPEAAGATLVLTRLDDDTLSGPMGIRFKRND